jgi:hypothetical protein
LDNVIKEWYENTQNAILIIKNIFCEVTGYFKSNGRLFPMVPASISYNVNKVQQGNICLQLKNSNPHG